MRDGEGAGSAAAAALPEAGSGRGVLAAELTTEPVALPSRHSPAPPVLLLPAPPLTRGAAAEAAASAVMAAPGREGFRSAAAKRGENWADAREASAGQRQCSGPVRSARGRLYGGAQVVWEVASARQRATLGC